MRPEDVELSPLAELRVLTEVPRLLLRLPWLVLGQPRGRGEPVMVIPGYGASDAATAVLRAYLGTLGYSVQGWGLGRNRGGVGKLMPRVLDQVSKLHEETGRALRLVGWSLGGVIAREVARERPEWVDRVITMGTPVIGGPKYTAVADKYRERGFDIEAIAAQVALREARPIEVPVTAIYSRHDGIVRWPACVDRINTQVQHVEVVSSHFGLGFHPDVYRLLAGRLAGVSR